jgi:hypothetical protein
MQIDIGLSHRSADTHHWQIALPGYNLCHPLDGKTAIQFVDFLHGIDCKSSGPGYRLRSCNASLTAATTLSGQKTVVLSFLYVVVFRAFSSSVPFIPSPAWFLLSLFTATWMQGG